MTEEKVWSMLSYYGQALRNLGVSPRQFETQEYDTRNLTRSQILEHCAWMCQHCLAVFRPQYEATAIYDDTHPDAVVAARAPLEKAMRWLGYIQGACNALEVFSCSELPTHSGEAPK